MLAKYFFDLFIFYKINCPLNYILYLKLSSANFDYWLPISMPYSRCPNLYRSVFCLRCRIYNSTYRQCWTNLYIQSREFKAGNVISCALLWIPYSAQQYAIIQHRTHSYRAICNETATQSALLWISGAPLSRVWLDTKSCSG